MTGPESLKILIADDYLSKPFNPRVPRARVQALIRRGEYRGAL